MITGLIALGWPAAIHSTSHWTVANAGTQIQRPVAARSETPAPFDLEPLGVYLSGTGQIIVVPAPEELVRKAVEQIQQLDILPIDEEDEEIVDQLFARATEGARVESLTRRM